MCVREIKWATLVDKAIGRDELIAASPEPLPSPRFVRLALRSPTGKSLEEGETKRAPRQPAAHSFRSPIFQARTTSGLPIWGCIHHKRTVVTLAGVALGAWPTSSSGSWGYAGYAGT